jgi:predicted GIY-YIG superfamily endonuclease
MARPPIIYDDTPWGRVETHFDWPCPNPDCDMVGLHYGVDDNEVSCIKCGHFGPATRFREHALYRAGHLLYVGITVDLGTRMRDHGTGKKWWPRVTRIDIERYPNRDQVEAAEITAIRTENPLFNVMHKTKANDPCPRCRGEEYLDGDNGMVLCPRCCGTGDA